MIKIYSGIIHYIFFLLLLLGLSGYVEAADTQLRGYQPIPMSSTSNFLGGNDLSELYSGDPGWSKPGNWLDPINGGGSNTDYDKPGQWIDPWLTENPEDVPIGDAWVLLLCTFVYGVWLSRRRQI